MIYLRFIFMRIHSKKINNHLPTAGEMKWSVLVHFCEGQRYGR